MKILLAALLILTAFPAFAEVGKVVATEGNAVIITGNSSRTATENAELEEGDVLRTTSTGLMHIEMIDGTKMIVGPSTEVIIDVADIGTNNTFESLAIRLSDGMMRFISGNSNKEAYEITTPTSTMGVEGTSFDLISTRREVRSVVFDGVVRICPTPRTRILGSTVEVTCKRQLDNCVVASTSRREVVGKYDQDSELAQFYLLLDEGNERVREDFRGNSQHCADRIIRAGGDEASLPMTVGDNPATATVTPEPPTTPPTPKPPTTPPSEPEDDGNNGHGDEDDGRDDSNPGGSNSDRVNNNASENNGRGGNNGNGGRERDGSKNPNKGNN